MITWKRSIISVNTSAFLFIMIMCLTACSRQTGTPTTQDNNKNDISKNTQNETQNTQETKETQASNSPSSQQESWIESGKCGRDAIWTYDGNTRILQITGTGVVDQVIKGSIEFRSLHGEEAYQVKEIRIGEGITALDAGPLFLNVYPVRVAIVEGKSTRYTWSSDGITLSLPDSLEKIGVDTFDPGYKSPCVRYIRHIHIPQRVRYIEGGALWGFEYDWISEKRKQEITVDARNPYYTVKDNVLFTKDFKTLVYYPSHKKDRVYRIPKSVTHISPLAFTGNSFLKEAVLPKGLKELGAGAFFHCRHLAKINLEQVKNLKRICDFDGIKHKISYGFGSSRGPFIGEENDYDGDDADDYYDEAFLNADAGNEYQSDFYEKGMGNWKDSFFLGTFAETALKSIQFPDRLKYVSYNTFSNCNHLKKISLGKSFAGEINPDQLCDQKGFTISLLPVVEIDVSKQNKHYKVRDHVLYSKDGKTVYQVLKSYRSSKLVFDKKVQKIARWACIRSDVRKQLRDVVVLGDLKQISVAAFAYSGIENFEVYGDMEKIGNMAFCCSHLKKFVCHGSVKHIGKLAFYRAEHMETLHFGKNIKSIGEAAFKDCGKIKKPRVRKN